MCHFSKRTKKRRHSVLHGGQNAVEAFARATTKEPPPGYGGGSFVGGSGWIRTTEAIMQQIYSLPPLAAREHSHMFPRSIECLIIIAKGLSNCKHFFSSLLFFPFFTNVPVLRSKIRHIWAFILWYDKVVTKLLQVQ